MPSRRPAALLAVLALTLGLGLSACGGDDDPKSKAGAKPSSTALPSATGPGTTPSVNFATGQDFFEALASNDPDQLTAVEDLVAPQSDAAGYVRALIASLSSAAEKPAALELRTPEPGVYRLCSTTGAGCSKVTAVVLTDGKVSSFKLDGKAVSKKSVARSE
ncbi:hypothetical protein ABIE44_003301 [Marmoricola sp. OAE513]|uniref:hypothetical protein n=1 Tax=Marmoricola sp. OAE513 TaxID=2817894 RepID=UPI001AE25593